MKLNDKDQELFSQSLLTRIAVLRESQKNMSMLQAALFDAEAKKDLKSYNRIFNTTFTIEDVDCGLAKAYKAGA